MRLLNILLLNTGAYITLTTSGGNHPIVNSKSVPISGTFKYTILKGADVASATFLQAGSDLSLDSNGEGSIYVDDNSVDTSDNVILVIQDSSNNNIIGAYEAVIS